MSDVPRPLSIPVLLGTPRKGRASVHAARLVTDLLHRRDGVRSTLIDVAAVPLPMDDAGEAIKDPGYAAAMAGADALVLVVPEYNHGIPGPLKHLLDSCLAEYVHKAVGIVGVSSGPFGGTRVVQHLLPVLRELGLVTIFWDVNIGQVERVFADDGRLLDEAIVRRSDRFLRELIWMATVLRRGREQVAVDVGAAVAPLACAACGGSMTRHAEKAVEAAGPYVTLALHACAACGAQAATPA
jgi:NAD(P)H-dependent FMN reductase